MLLAPLQLSAEVNVYATRNGDSTSVNTDSIVQKAQKEVSCLLASLLSRVMVCCAIYDSTQYLYFKKTYRKYSVVTKREHIAL